MCVFVCFVYWLELDSSIALCNLSSLYTTSSSKYSGLFFEDQRAQPNSAVQSLDRSILNFGKSDHKIRSFN